MTIRSTALTFIAACSPFALLLASAPGAKAQEAPTETVAAPAASAVSEDEAGRRWRELDDRTSLLERKLQSYGQEASKSKKTATATAGEKGFAIKSSDSAFVVKLRGLLHADGRQFFDDQALRPSSTFVISRARPTLEGTFFDVADFRVMTDFGNGQTTLMDAYGDLHPLPWLRLRAGKFTPPVGLERLQSASAIVFAERALPTALVPNRDVGIQLHGAIADGLVSYAAGVWNGVVDGAKGDADNGFAKDLVGRVFVQPWKSDPSSPLSGLGVGLAASTGNRLGKGAVLSTSGTSTTVTTASSPSLPSYKSVGQQTAFSYLVDDKGSATVLAQGRHTRLAPQAYFYVGPLGLLGEYVRSTHSVVMGADAAKLSHSAWQVAATFLIGQGRNSYEGVQVGNPVDGTLRRFGVLELALRYGELRIDADAFPLYADANKSIKVARAWGAAVNWHWNRNVKLASTYDETYFEGGAAAGADRRTERVLTGRLQLAF